MTAFGYASLLLALAASLYAVPACALGAGDKRAWMLKSGRGASGAACGLTTLAVGLLMAALLNHDFSLEYVASYSSRGMSPPYLAGALWAGNEGSLLVWGWLLSICGVVVAFTRGPGRELAPRASAVIAAVQVFFLLLLVTVSNPFRGMPFAVDDGRGLNPLLENAGMLSHPPLLLAGYVLLVVPYAFAMSALMGGKPGANWLAASRRWMLLAWLFLGAGNVIGMWWAYVELGWGGYWAWDPVENAGLLPWLTATAFLHSAMVERRRGGFKTWNITLAALTFLLSIFGTYLTRSGLVASVHTYGVSALGPFFVVFLLLGLAAPSALMVYRRAWLKSAREPDPLLSRESAFYFNNLLLVAATFATLVGTLLPAISGWLTGATVEAGAGYYNLVNGALFLSIILLSGLCAALEWRSSRPRGLGARLLGPFAIALGIAAILLVAGMRPWVAVAGFALCAFVPASLAASAWRSVRARTRLKGVNTARAFRELLVVNRVRYGGSLVHLGVILMTIGILGSSFYAVEKEAVLKPGASVMAGDYLLTFSGRRVVESPDRVVVQAVMDVSRDGNPVGTLAPERIFHRSFDEAVGEVAIRSTPAEDLYVILQGWEEDGTASFTILVNPLVAWIWTGGSLLLAGGLLAFWPGRRQPEAGTDAP